MVHTEAPLWLTSGPVCSRATKVANEHDDALARVDHVLDLRAICSPRLKPPQPSGPQAFQTGIRNIPAATRSRDIHDIGAHVAADLTIGMEQRPNCFEHLARGSVTSSASSADDAPLETARSEGGARLRLSVAFQRRSVNSVLSRD